MADVGNSAVNVPLNNKIEWTVQHEVQFLLALLGHKPVGIAKYFHMACILEKFSNAIHRNDISSKVIWDRLDTMYDLQALEETELIPFPNETQEFCLPESHYGNLVEQKKNKTMPPPRVPSPLPDVKKEEITDTKRESLKDVNSKKDSKEAVKRVDDKKLAVTVKDGKKDTKEDVKKDKRHFKDGSEEKKREKEVLKSKDVSCKEQRGIKRGTPMKDDEDSSVSSSGSSKRGREKDNSDTDEPLIPSKRSNPSYIPSQSVNSKGKRQTRLSQAKVSDDSGSNKSVSPITVSSSTVKRRRHV